MHGIVDAELRDWSLGEYLHAMIWNWVSFEEFEVWTGSRGSEERCGSIC